MTFKKNLRHSQGLIFTPSLLLSCLLVSSFCLCPNIASAEEKAKGEKKDEKSEEKNSEGAAPQDDPLEPGAEHLCESEISYVWTRMTVLKKKDPKSGKEELVFEPGATEDEFYATVGETGQVKTEVAHRLNVKLPSMQDEAMNYCRQTHQNLTGCTGSWLDSSNNDYSTMDFELRKKLLASIKERCENSYGLCIDTRSSLVKCHISRSPDVRKVEPAAAKSSGKTEEKAKTKSGGKK